MNEGHVEQRELLSDEESMAATIRMRSKLDAGGIPTTTVTIVVGKREVTVISNLHAQNVLAVAKQVS